MVHKTDNRLNRGGPFEGRKEKDMTKREKKAIAEMDEQIPFGEFVKRFEGKKYGLTPITIGGKFYASNGYYTYRETETGKKVYVK